MWRTPILFFGKVVDENSKPVPGVKVTYGANAADELLTKEIRNEGTTTSDIRGIFKISGIRGRTFVLELTHPSYYSSSTNPPGYAYADELTSKNGVPDSEEKAMLFYMRHKGNPTALVQRRAALNSLTDGTTKDFTLRGKARSEIIGHLQIQAWKGEPSLKSGNHFDWKVKVSVPQGGVLAIRKEFDFVAPESGYEQTLEFQMSKDDANWSLNLEQNIFLKFPNYYVRGRVFIDLFEDLFFSLNYFVNPDGSRNLENDPTQPFSEP